MNRCLSAKIAESLREELAAGRYRAGEELPSVAALGNRFGAGEYAVRHALRRLRDEGLLKLKSHIGSIVAPTLSRAWKGHVALVHTSRRSAYFVSRLSIVLGEHFEAAGWCYHPVFTATARDGIIDTSSIERHVANGLDFAIVYSEFRQIAELFDRAGVPYIVLNGFARDFPNARGIVREDFRPAFQSLVAALKAHGVRTVLDFDFGRRMDRTFKSLLFQAGMEPHMAFSEWDNERPHRLGEIKALGRRAVSAYLSDPRNRARLPDAILFNDDYFAAGGVVALLEAGLKIPDDIRVISFSNCGDEPPLGASVARVENDPDTYGAAVATYVLKLLAGKRAAPPRIAYRFIPGGSL